jgi:hypothetical protein
LRFVSAAGDPLRLLHKDPAHGYTSNPAAAAKHEPECVSREVQAELSAQGRRRDAERIRSAWSKAHRGIDDALAAFSLEVGPAGGRPIRSATAAVARAANRVDRAVVEQLGI